MTKIALAAGLIATAVSGCISQQAERQQLYTSEADDDLYCRGLGLRAENPAYIDCRLAARRQMATGHTGRMDAIRRSLEEAGRR